MQHAMAVDTWRKACAKRAWHAARRELYAYDGLFLDNHRYATYVYLFHLYLKG